MSRLLLRWILLAISVVLASYLCQLLGLQFKVDVSSAGQVGKLFIGVALWALLNATLGNILKLLTIPLNCLTFGLVSLVINGLMLWIVASQKFGFTIEGGPGELPALEHVSEGVVIDELRSGCIDEKAVDFIISRRSREMIRSVWGPKDR